MSECSSKKKLSPVSAVSVPESNAHVLITNVWYELSAEKKKIFLSVHLNIFFINLLILNFERIKLIN